MILEPLISPESDVESSQSVGSGIDTCSGHTSLLGVTDKSSLSCGTATPIVDCGNSNQSEEDGKALSSMHSLKVDVASKGTLLPWGVHKERCPNTTAGLNIDMDIRPGEFVMQSLFADFTLQAEKKIEAVMLEAQAIRITFVV